MLYYSPYYLCYITLHITYVVLLSTSPMLYYFAQYLCYSTLRVTSVILLSPHHLCRITLHITSVILHSPLPILHPLLYLSAPSVSCCSKRAISASSLLINWSMSISSLVF